MKYVLEYRRPELVKAMASKIKDVVKDNRTYRIMEFCGGHTHTIAKYGIEDLLPENVALIHGPGCPVCVLPIGRIDMAIELSLKKDVILCTYGDMMRVPGSDKKSLFSARSEGSDVRMVYSVLDALNIAKNNPDKKIVFFAIGFETTTPPTAMALEEAKKTNLKNFFVFCNHVMTKPALTAVLDGEAGDKLDGFIAPGHVAMVSGTKIFDHFADKYNRPLAVTGFEPADLMQSIYALIERINQDKGEVINQYNRAISHEGNVKAQELIAKVFSKKSDFEWRGLGTLPDSALKLADDYSYMDAEIEFDLEPRTVPDHAGCACPDVIRGFKRPSDCKLFGKVCTPDNPVGSCMVSNEGACAAYWSYGRMKEQGKIA